MRIVNLVHKLDTDELQIILIAAYIYRRPKKNKIKFTCSKTWSTSTSAWGMPSNSRDKVTVLRRMTPVIE